MLVAFDVALEVINLLRPILKQIERHDSELAKQLKRSSSNTAGNLAEGMCRQAGNKRRAYEIAHGEARETLGWLQIASAWGYTLDDRDVRIALDRLLRLLYGLTIDKKSAS